jgi:Ca-activated chloride channel family protein
MRFLRPDMARWFLILPVVVACWLMHDRYVRAFRRRAAIAPRFAWLSRRTGGRRRIAVLATAVCAVAALAFALVRPQILLAQRIPDYERQDLVIMLDRSASMRAHDIIPSRFTRATLEIRNFLKKKSEAIDRVGLVGFADSSLVLSYLTSDVGSLFFYLDYIDGDPHPLFGTNIGAALMSALEVARKDDRPTRKVFLLVSDGEDYGNELNKALATFRADGLRVHCIGIGSDDAVNIPLLSPDGRETYLKDDNGRLVKTRFSETTLKQIASATGGRYFRSMTGSELTSAIDEIVKGERKLLGWKSTTDYRELYPAGLAAAAIAGAALWLLL